MCRIARFRDAGDDVDHGRFLRFNRNGAANGHDRIEHRALAVRKRRRAVHCLRVGNAAAAAKKLGSVGFIGSRADRRAMHRHQMQHPGRMFFMRTRAAGAQNCLAVANNLGLHEQIAEGRMSCVRRGAGQNHFRVARQFNRASESGKVPDADSAQLDVVFGRNGHFGVRFQLKVASAKFRP